MDIKENEILLSKAIKIKTSSFKLQPLKITNGWAVHWNHFTSADPLKLSEDAVEWIDFSEDLALFVNEYYNLSIDVGWYGGLNPEGFYRVSLASKDKEIEAFSSIDIDKITDVINYFFQFPCLIK